MFNLSPLKLLLIVVVITVLLGPDKLPDVAYKIGRSWRLLQGFQRKIETEIREAIPELPNSQDLVRMARSPINLLNTLADRTENQPSSESEPDLSQSSDTLTPRGGKSGVEATSPRFSYPVPTDPTLN